MGPKTLLELRLLATTRFDSRPLLAVVLAGDGRLSDALAREDLLPLGTRMRVRLSLDYAAREELAACLDHLLASAGNPALMSASLKQTLCERAGGNFRVLTNLASQLLTAAMQRELTALDDKLYLELFAAPASAAKAAARDGRLQPDEAPSSPARSARHPAAAVRRGRRGGGRLPGRIALPLR